MGSDLEEHLGLLHGVGNNREVLEMELLNTLKGINLKWINMWLLLKVISEVQNS